MGRDHTGVGTYYKNNDSIEFMNKYDLGISIIKFNEIMYNKNTNEYFETSNKLIPNNSEKISATLIRDYIKNKQNINSFLINPIILDNIQYYINNQNNILIS